MGRARLALKELRERKPIRKWLTLTDEYGRKDKRRGQVDVVAWHMYRGKFVVQIPNQVDDAAEEGPCNQICICLVRAWNLPVRQHKSEGCRRAADPFCVWRCGEQERATQVEEGTVHPCTRRFTSFWRPKKLKWDYDVLGLRRPSHHARRLRERRSWLVSLLILMLRAVTVGREDLKTCDIASDKDESYRVWLPLRDEFGQIKTGSRGIVRALAHIFETVESHTDVVEVAEGVTEERVYRPGKPTGMCPEQLV